MDAYGRTFEMYIFQLRSRPRTNSQTLTPRERSMERERCTRWSGRLKPGCLETLRSTSLAEQEHPIKWLGVFDGPPPQGHIGAGYFVQIQTTQLSKNKMEYFMGKIFGDCFEDLEPMRSPHNAFCEREPAFSIGTRDRQGRRPLRTAPPESVVRHVPPSRGGACHRCVRVRRGSACSQGSWARVACGRCVRARHGSACSRGTRARLARIAAGGR